MRRGLGEDEVRMTYLPLGYRHSQHLFRHPALHVLGQSTTLVGVRQHCDDQSIIREDREGRDLAVGPTPVMDVAVATYSISSR